MREKGGGNQGWRRVCFFWGDGNRHVKGAAAEPLDLQTDLPSFPLPTLLFLGSLAPTLPSASPQSLAQAFLTLVITSNMFFWLELTLTCSPS